MKKEVIIGVLVYFALVINGIIGLVNGDGDSAMAQILFAFPIITIPYFLHYDVSKFNKTLLRLIYYSGLVVFLLLVLFGNHQLGEVFTEDDALLVVLIVYAAAGALVLYGFGGYLIFLVDTWDDDRLKILSITSGILFLGAVMTSDYEMISIVISLVFALHSVYTLYRLYIKQF